MRFLGVRNILQCRHNQSDSRSWVQKSDESGRPCNLIRSKLLFVLGTCQLDIPSSNHPRMSSYLPGHHGILRRTCMIHGQCCLCATLFSKDNSSMRKGSYCSAADCKCSRDNRHKVTRLAPSCISRLHKLCMYPRCYPESQHCKSNLPKRPYRSASLNQAGSPGIHWRLQGSTELHCIPYTQRSSSPQSTFPARMKHIYCCPSAHPDPTRNTLQRNGNQSLHCFLELR